MAAYAMEPASSHPMVSPTKSWDSHEVALEHEIQVAELTTEKVDPQKYDKKVASYGEGPDSERDESPLPPLLRRKKKRSLRRS